MRMLSTTLALVIAGGIVAAGQKKPTATMVTATFRCPDANLPDCADAIQGDGNPLTGNPRNGGGASIGTGALHIRLSDQQTPGRYLRLAFPEPSDVPPCSTGSTACRKDFTTGDVTFVDAFWVFPLAADGSDLTGGFLAMTPGTSLDARIKFNFRHPDNSALFTLWYAAASHAGSTYARVTRTGPDSWTVAAPTGSLARLTALAGKGQGVTTDEGLYEMAFSLDVVR
jgi:hypothetical protein